MTTATAASAPPETSDAELVARSRSGDRDAYATIVQRHQSTICALTYAACGDVHRSEDLAQETFLAAWKSLRDLKEPAQLRAWLRGIARNVAHCAVRKETRSVPTQPELMNEPASGEPTPCDDAITREEQAILWQNLARLPEEYREPLVLYYRQEHSAAAVARAMGISDDAARQRLSRGRAMLAERIERLIDRGLRASAPSRSFTLSVVTALPAITAQHAISSVVTSAAVKGGASSKLATAIGATAGLIFGPLAGISTMYLSYRAGIEQTIAPEEKKLIRRFWILIFVLAGVYDLVLFVAILAAGFFEVGPGTLTTTLVTMTAVFCATVATQAAKFRRQFRQIRARLVAAEPALAASAQRAARLWYWEYRTKRKLLGLPLVHIQVGSTADMRPQSVKAWIAVGTYAYSPLIAIGGFAVAPMSWGATSIGILTYGVIAIGWWSIGVFAIGFKAVGVCAVAWHAAGGVVALAHGYAEGVSAFAHHANNARAARVLRADWFFRSWAKTMEHANWIWVLAVVPLIAMFVRARKLRRAESTAK